MEVLDFEVPAEWQFGEDAYPTAAKRLVNSLAGGKKKSNKHLSEERIEDVISKNVQLPIQLAQQPEADAGGSTLPTGGCMHTRCPADQVFRPLTCSA